MLALRGVTESCRPHPLNVTRGVKLLLSVSAVLRREVTYYSPLRQEVGPEEGKRGKQTDRDRERARAKDWGETERGRESEGEERYRETEPLEPKRKSFVLCGGVLCFVSFFGVDSGQNGAVFFRTIRHCLEFDW